jgi:hypothetical protein
MDYGSVAWPHADQHYGDSEAIGLTVYFDFPTQHWFLEEAFYSTHADYGHYSRGSNKYPADLEYPGAPGTHPRAYVAFRKHGSYANASECENGNYGLDSCGDGTARARVETWLVNGESGNIGSEAVNFANCVISFYYGAGGRQECYWTGGNFRGWVPDSYGEKSSSPQMWRLTDFGFMPPPPPEDPPAECGHWEVRPVLDGEGQETGHYENVWVPEECEP